MLLPSRNFKKIRFSRHQIFWLLSVSILLVSCEKYDFARVEFTKVITVGAIEVFSSSAFLTGDIEGLRAGRVTGSGFVYSARVSTDESLRSGAPNVLPLMKAVFRGLCMTTSLLRDELGRFRSP
ncbi:MAG: hypothetical protein OEQ53_04420 [Saprospiraceae bacterium]|nr:hypothetical protein [Saprospiraceae bacterium]